MRPNRPDAGVLYGAGRASPNPRVSAGRSLSCLVATVLVACAAVGAPSAAAVTRDQVFAALKLDQVPADYVVLIDNSGSMRVSGLYARVRAALAPLLHAMDPQDNLSLITFAGSPTLRYSGLRGSDPQRVIAQLPAQAYGTGGTDIGAALSTALSELERPNAAAVGAVILMTDGVQNAPAGSAFATTSGKAWETLGVRGRALAARHTIGAYALALAPASQSGLLGRAFATAEVVALPRDQLAPYLQRVKDLTRVAKARQLVAADSAQSVEISWPANVTHLKPTSGPAAIRVLLRSHLAHVPVTLSNLSVAAVGVRIDASRLPTSVTLEPGRTATVALELRPSRAVGFRVGQKTVAERGTLTLRAALSTPWATVLHDQLSVPFRPRLVGAATRVRAAAVVGRGLLGLGLLLVLAVLVIWLAAYRLVDRRPKLRGALTVTGPEIPPLRVALHGRVVKIGRGKEIDLPARGRVSGVRVKKRGRRKGTDTELLIRYGSGAPTRLASGHAKNIGELNFAYRGL
jgi:hypothetical protein